MGLMENPKRHICKHVQHSFRPYRRILNCWDMEVYLSTDCLACFIIKIFEVYGERILVIFGKVRQPFLGYVDPNRFPF